MMSGLASRTHLIRRFIAALIILNGLVILVLAVARTLPERGTLLRAVLPVEMSLGSRTLTVVAGFALIMLGRGLARGKRHAWLIAFPLLLITALLHLLKDLDVEQALIALVLATILWLRRSDYRAGSDTPSLYRGYLALLGGLAVAFFYSVGGLMVLRIRGGHPIHPTVLRHAVHTGLRLVTFQHVRLHHPAAHMDWFVHSVPVLSAVAIMYGLAMILRPTVLRRRVTRDERVWMQALVRQWGCNPLAPYALQDDKAYFFNAERTAALAYRIAGEVAVVAGDPIGPPDQIPALLDAFLAYCRAQGWIPSFYQTLPETLPLYRARGFKTLTIGEDAVVDLAGFTLSGKRMANVRHSVTHAERAGLRVRTGRLRDLDASLRAQLEEISREWLGGRMNAEMGFSMGSLDDLLDDETLAAVAVDAAGMAWAFITLVPLAARRSWILDLMRRRDQAPGGAMELLIARTAEYLRARGAATFSLSLAPLASTHPSEEDTSPMVRRAREFLYDHFDHLYAYRSLQRFKDKFNPRWEQRYLVYPADAPLATVIAAVVRVHLTRPSAAPSPLERLRQHLRLPHKTSPSTRLRRQAHGRGTAPEGAA